MKWILKTFNELTLKEFHDIIQLRLDIFVVEQDCPYLDLDGKDFKAYHFFGQLDDGSEKIVAYTRIFAPGDYFKEASIGRVVVHADYRKDGIGFQLMEKSAEQISILFKVDVIKIGAQLYLKNFYESLGFKKIGEGYLEDGIPHIYMIKK
jgi:ElaA protein